jgi:hypothetical protein
MRDTRRGAGVPEKSGIIDPSYQERFRPADDAWDRDSRDGSTRAQLRPPSPGSGAGKREFLLRCMPPSSRQMPVRSLMQHG